MADDGNGDRGRELFPIPPMASFSREITGSVSSRRRRARVTRLISESNAVINCLNEMYHPSNNFQHAGPPSLSQRTAQHCVFSQLARQQLPAVTCKVREAAQELLQSSLSYSGEEAGSATVSYDRRLVSLPEVAAEPIDVSNVLDGPGRDVVEDASHCMLWGPQEWGVEKEKNKPVEIYMDPILKNNLHEYCVFIKDLFEKGMLQFTSHPQDLISPFFVAKKSGKQRLVLDCRAVNQRFRPPPRVALAAGYSWSRLHIPEGETLFTAQSDIRDYFYSLSLPAELRELFCLPPIPHSLLREWQVPFELGGGCASSGGWVWPCMRVVPMGWSWAMWIAQRVHTEQVMIATGIGADQILVDNAPAPSLSKDSVVVIPYADNLNVCGLDADVVQRVKDQAVSHLQNLGFRIHEEIDASERVQSLGFEVDGRAGVVRPVKDKLMKVIATFHWLTRRPRLRGRAVEKLIGHATHFMLLRRDLLSVFRHMYDFARVNYDRRVRLWPEAAREAKWAAWLLRLCSADLRRKWDEEITSSDASLSGIAVCKRSLDVDTIKEVGKYKEAWRFKVKHPTAKPREVALGDPFSDPETVKPIDVAYDPFELDYNFPEVDSACLQREEWNLCFNTRMNIPEHITILEGRGFVASLRHKLRAVRSFSKNHLHLGDNLGMVLSAEKGRSNAYGLLRVCRRLCSLALASDCHFSYRWIPSEKNVADHASRQWEYLRRGVDVVRGEAQISKAEVDSSVYPNRHAVGKYRPTEAARSRRSSCSSWSEEVLCSPGSEYAEGQQQGRAQGEADSVCKGQGSKEEVPGPIIARTRGSLRKSSHRLSTSVQRVPGFCETSEVFNSGIDQLGQCLRRISESYVSRRYKRRRGLKVDGRGVRQPPRMWPQDFPPSLQEVLAGMASVGSTSKKGSTPFPTGGFVGADHVEQTQDAGSSINHAHVRGIPETMGASGHQQTRLGAAQSELSSLQHQPAPIQPRRSVQNGADRRSHHVGQQSHAISGDVPAASESKISRSASLTGGCSDPPADLGVHVGRHRSQKISCRPSSTSPLRSKLRHADQGQNTARNQAQRPLGIRQLSTPLRESCLAGTGISEPSQQSAKASHQSRAKPTSHGPKVFQAEVTWNGWWVVEVFSGCARLSRACARAGFHVIAYDIEYGKDCDLLVRRNLNKLIRFIHSHPIALVWLGTPCISWSRARRNDGGPCPLRDDSTFLMGFPNMSPKDGEKIRVGNQLLAVTLDICAVCIKLHIRFVIENPFTSRLWLTAGIHQLLQTGGILSRLDFCAFNTPWRKATGLLHWHFDELQTVCRCCSPASGRCSFSGKRHIILSGKDASGLWMTRVAQPYPHKMCVTIADLLARTI